MNKYLRSTSVVDWDHPAVAARARGLRDSATDDRLVAQRCFEWVRDEIKHTQDFRLTRVTCAASEVLEAGSGYCYAKSHLLAALLRANGIPAGFCYQRLSMDEHGTTFCLHGLNAVQLPGVGWYRIDARGNRADVNAQFAPPREHLAFALTLPGETDLPEIWPDPLPLVVDALRSHDTAESLGRHLPDVVLWK